MEPVQVTRRPWTEKETILALFLYFQTPFGKIHHRNPEIQQLAVSLDRSSNSIAMKLANFASLDPKITGAGKKGLAGASKLDRQIYARFALDWEELIEIAASDWDTRFSEVDGSRIENRMRDKAISFDLQPYTGQSTVEATVLQRRGQVFFRRAVLANYSERCCITGIAEPKLLIASHILPWGKDVENRHNPENGVLLSATMDKAFDQGLITIERTGKVLVARELMAHASDETRQYFREFHGKTVRSAVRFDPDPEFLQWHNRHRFVDGFFGN